MDVVNQPPGSQIMSDILGVFVTTRCPVGCRHCYLGAGLERSSIDVANYRLWIDQLKSDSGIRFICLTGGEPFHLRGNLERIVRETSERGLRVNAITSAVWAISDGQADIIMARLAECGLSTLVVSVDDYHQERVPASRVRSALKAARDHGIAHYISYSHHGWPKSTEIEERVHALIGDVPESTRIVHGQIYRLGRAVTHIDLSAFSDAEEASELCSNMCLTVTPDGQVLSCGCALGTPASHGLRLGDLANNRLGPLHDQWLSDPVLMFLQTEGLGRLQEEASVVGIHSTSEVAGQETCEKCLRLLAHAELVSHLREKYGTPTQLRRMAVRRFLLYGDPSLIAATVQ